MKKILFFAGVLALMGVVSVNAATFAGGDAYSLEATEVVEENLYAAGGNVNIAGNVYGDLLTAGGNIAVAGRVSKDLTVAGGTINVTGNVGEDLRIAGGNITIANGIGGELVGAGGQISVLSSASVGGDLNLSGGVVRLEAPVRGDAEVNGGEIYINGLVAGNLVVRGESIRLGPSANIRGNFNYYSSAEAVIDEGAVVAGETVLHEVKAPLEKGDAAGFIAGFAIIKILVTAFVAILFVHFFRKRWAEGFVHDTTDNFWRRALLGFAVMILAPVASFLLMITIVGLIPAGLILLIYLTGLLLTKIFTGILTAALINKHIIKKPLGELQWWKILVGVAAYSLVGMIPFVGWLISGLILFASLGWMAYTVGGALARVRG